jgi:hypothetical protein
MPLILFPLAHSLMVVRVRGDHRGEIAFAGIKRMIHSGNPHTLRLEFISALTRAWNVDRIELSHNYGHKHIFFLCELCGLCER